MADTWQTNSALQLPDLTTQLYGGGTVNYGDYTNAGVTGSAFDLGTSDMSGMDWAKMGIGGINSIMGALGTFDTMKTNSLQRDAMQQNMKHAKMARADRTAFLGNTASAFA